MFTNAQNYFFKGHSWDLMAIHVFESSDTGLPKRVKHECPSMFTNAQNYFFNDHSWDLMAIHVIYSVKTTTSCLPIIVVVGVKEWWGL